MVYQYIDAKPFCTIVWLGPVELMPYGAIKAIVNWAGGRPCRVTPAVSMTHRMRPGGSTRLPERLVT